MTVITISQDATALAGLLTALRSRITHEILGIDNGFQALRMLEFNPARLVILDLAHTPRAWARTFARDYGHVPCVGLGGDPAKQDELREYLPADTIFLPEPIDWDEVARFVEGSVQKADAAPMAISAVGLEELLMLLAMSGADAEVHVSAGIKHGALTLREGLVVHARCGRRTGEAAALELLGLTGARARSLPPTAEIRPTMSASVSELLHEAARIVDELARLSTDREVERVLAHLQQSGATIGVALIDVSSSRLLAMQGEAQGERTAAELVRATMLLERSPLANRTGEIDGRGLMAWADDRTVVVVPVHAKVSLAASLWGHAAGADVIASMQAAADVLAHVVTSRLSGSASTAGARWG